MHCIKLEHKIWLISHLENLLSIVNGFIRSRLDRMTLLIAKRLALLPEVLLKSMALIMRRLLLMWLDFLLSGLLLPFLRLANGHSFRWISKMINGELLEEVYMKLPPGYSHPPGFPHRVF